MIIIVKTILQIILKKGYFLSILCLIVYLVVKGLDSSLKYEYLINDIINGDTYI